jgi:cytoskeletal protein RodZ
MDGATLDSDLGLRNVRLPASHKTAVTPPPVVEAQAVHKRTNWMMIGIAAAIIALAGTWLVLRVRMHAESTQAAAPPAATDTVPPSNAPPQPATIAAAPPSTNTPPASSNVPAATPLQPESAKAAASKKSKLDTKLQLALSDAASKPIESPIVVAPTPTPLVPAIAPPEVAPSRVDFDPNTLNPNDSARLRVEADHFPASFGFTVEMDGKIYLERGVKPQIVFDNLYAPPGIHEFRVTAGLGATHKISNIVSTDFRAKKKKTLRIELRDKINANITPQSLNSDSVLVLTLK